MIHVGLTGSIAVGKSYVASLFAQLGCYVIDADLTARAVVEPGTKGLREVVAAFGEEVLRPNNSLDRRKLGSIVFGDPDKRLLLNSILHPLIIAAQDEEMQRAARRAPRGVCMVDAALMIESGGFRRFDKLIVVHCRDEIQLARLMQRESITNAEARRRIAAQMPQEEKKRYAHYLIDTSDGYETARQQTVAVFHELKELSADRLNSGGH